MIYLIGSLRNPAIPTIANQLTNAGHAVFGSWFAAGEIADDSWQAYETARGIPYRTALYGVAANHVYEFDKTWLDICHTGVLVLPAGKSAHMELGYMRGQLKPTYVLFDKEPERWDVMYRLAGDVVFSVEELIERLG